MGGPMPSLRFGKQFEHRRGQQVRGRMAINGKRVGILGGEDLELGVGISRGRVRSYNSPFTLATMAASARRGLMSRAISRGLVPASTDF